uniref:DUF7597 domain-containing protein n=1 Tax=Oryza glumipatula TaxID=40148 RepID=A0A0D9YK98_9ORYZ
MDPHPIVVFLSTPLPPNLAAATAATAAIVPAVAPVSDVVAAPPSDLAIVAPPPCFWCEGGTETVEHMDCTWHELVAGKRKPRRTTTKYGNNSDIPSPQKSTDHITQTGGPVFTEHEYGRFPVISSIVTPALPGGWNFSPGDAIRDEAWHRFRSHVHFSSKFNSTPFRLVVDLPRSNFRLTTSSVALALRAAIGGSLANLAISHLKDRSFSFVEKDWVLVAPKKRSTSSLRRSYRSYVQAVQHHDILIKQVFYKLKEPLLHASKPGQQRISVFHQLDSGKTASVIPLVISKAAGDGPEATPVTELIAHAEGTQDPNLLLNSNLENSTCGRCLQKGHFRASCPGPLRCRAYLKLGHLAHYYLASKPAKAQHPKNPKPSARSTAVWKAKTKLPEISASSRNHSSPNHTVHPIHDSSLLPPMANLNPNPQRFLRQGHIVQGEISASPELTSLFRSDLPGGMKQDWDHHRVLIANYIQDELHYEVRNSFRHPSAVGFFQMRSAMNRDALVLSPPEFYDGDADRMLGRVFVRAKYRDQDSVPRKIVLFDPLGAEEGENFGQFRPSCLKGILLISLLKKTSPLRDHNQGLMMRLMRIQMMFGNPGNQGAAVGGRLGQDHPMGQIEENPGQLIILPQQFMGAEASQPPAGLPIRVVTVQDPILDPQVQRFLAQLDKIVRNEVPRHPYFYPMNGLIERIDFLCKAKGIM